MNWTRQFGDGASNANMTRDDTGHQQLASFRQRAM
jgi:hypothetical protein